LERGQMTNPGSHADGIAEVDHLMMRPVCSL